MNDKAVFSVRRDLRKTLAESEGVPVYANFTNEQFRYRTNALQERLRASAMGWTEPPTAASAAGA